MEASIRINKLIIGEIRFLFWRILWMAIFVQKLLPMSKLRHSTGRAGNAGKKDFSPHTKQACEQPDSIELPSVWRLCCFGGFVA